MVTVERVKRLRLPRRLLRRRLCRRLRRRRRLPRRRKPLIYLEDCSIHRNRFAAHRLLKFHSSKIFYSSKARSQRVVT